MKQKLSTSLKNINFKLFLALLVLGLCPTVYTTVRVFFLGQLPGDWSFSIAGQLSWVNLLYEVVSEAIILPLFYFVGKVKQNRAAFSNRVRTGMLVSLGAYLVLSARVTAAGGAVGSTVSPLTGSATTVTLIRDVMMFSVPLAIESLASHLPETAVIWISSSSSTKLPSIVPDALYTLPSGFVPEKVAVHPAGRSSPRIRKRICLPFSFCESTRKDSGPPDVG